MSIVAGYILLIVLFYQLPDDKFHIFFLDIGQGDSIFVKTPENHQVLIDGGPENSVIEQLGQIMPFFDKSLDLVVLTHPHADHVNGLVEVLKRFEVENVLITGVAHKNPGYSEFLREIERQNINVLVADSVMDFKLGKVFMDIIYPFNQINGQKFSNINNSSIAVKLFYKGKKILLSGDLEFEAEEELIESGLDLRANIFKAGHHGSRTSSTFDFLKKINPEIVIIQTGKENSYGHPHQETLDNLDKLGIEKIYRNDLQGRIEFVF